MSIVYSRQETIDAVKSAMKQSENLYKDESLNWSGITKDTCEYYTEVVSEEILNNLQQLKNINTITRSNSYKMNNHNEILIKRDENKEVQIAKRLCGLELEEIGLIIDYQVPLKDSNDNKGVGKIDLISYNKKKNTIYLLELKFNSDETLLRAMLESYTYFSILDKDKLLKDYCEHFEGINTENIKIKSAVLLTGKCENANKEATDIECGDRRFEKALSLMLNVHVFSVEMFTDKHVF